MPQIGWFELLVIVLLAILIIGPKDFPIVINKIGKWTGSAKRYFSEIQKDVTDLKGTNKATRIYNPDASSNEMRFGYRFRVNDDGNGNDEDHDRDNHEDNDGNHKRSNGNCNGNGKEHNNDKCNYDNDGIDRIAELASEINQNVENIGARRLHTIMEKLLEDISYIASDIGPQKVNINTEYVEKNLGEIIKSQDLSKFIL